MGFLDGLKKSAKNLTGLGLSAHEQYQRAYTKGVFLQPPDYNAASKNFLSASEKYQEEGDRGMALRSTLNSKLYSFFSLKGTDGIDDIISLLERIDQVERIGSQTEMVSSGVLMLELKGYRLERSADVSSNLTEKAEHYRNASRHYMQMGSNQFTFVENFPLGGPKDEPIHRGYYTKAMSDFYEAMVQVNTSPEGAQSKFLESLMGFRQSRDEEWTGKLDGYVNRIKVRRHCWVCQREVQGEDIHFKHYPSDVAPYFKEVVRGLDQDEKMLERENSITVCSACGSMVEKQADIYATMRADEVRYWAEPILNGHTTDIANLWAAVKNLQMSEHRHY